MTKNKGRPDRPTPELTDKQKMFCAEYIKDFNATRAATDAGYSAKTAKNIAHDTLTKVHVQDEIQRLMTKRSERVQIDADDVLRSILDIRDTCAKKLDITSRSGDVIGESLVDVNGAIKANELLGKHLKLFTDRVEVSGDITININGEVKEWGK